LWYKEGVGWISKEYVKVFYELKFDIMFFSVHLMH